jgi:AcrR family transcriptional regulator
VTTGAVPQRSDAFWAVPRSAQKDRYERVMRATIDLAREGGYNAVQMRDVAKRSGVALGTVYTYFQSRDNLVYRATVAWNARVAEETARAAQAEGGQGLESLEADVRRMALQYHADPGLLDAFVRSTLSTDPVVVEQRRNVDWEWWTDLYPQLDLLGPQIAAVAPRLLTDVFYSGALRWAFGQVDFSEVVEQLTAVVRLMIRAARAE